MLKVSSNRGSLDSSGTWAHACQTRSVNPFVRKIFNQSEKLLIERQLFKTLF